MRHSAPKEGAKRADKKAVTPLTRSKTTASERGSMKSAKNKRASRKTGAAAKQQSTVLEMPAIAFPPAATAAVAEAPQVCEPAMAATTNPSDIVLPATCGLREVGALKDGLLPHLDSEQVVAVDAAAVERIDTAALQVLVSFVRERHAQARKIEWRGLNEAFLEAVRLLGLGAHLHLPASAGAA